MAEPPVAMVQIHPRIPADLDARIMAWARRRNVPTKTFGHIQAMTIGIDVLEALEQQEVLAELLIRTGRVTREALGR